jgi:hypothetical protein
MNRTLFDITRPFIIDCTVLTPFGGDAIRAACQICNRLPFESINNISPHQLWFRNAPTFKTFRRFGCIAYARILSIPREAKVKPHGIRCCFLGYVNISQGVFLLWDLQHGRQIQSRDVRFIEGQSPTHEEFDKASLLAPIVDDTRIDQSGQEPRTPSDPRISSDVASDASSDGEDEDVVNAQRMDIEAPHTTITGTLRERETDPALNKPVTPSLQKILQN